MSSLLIFAKKSVAVFCSATDELFSALGWICLVEMDYVKILGHIKSV